MVKLLLLVPPAAAIVGQTAPTDPSPFVQWGLAGALVAFLLWLLIDERKDHRRLRDKVLSDFLPALLANSEQMKESAAATVMVHQLLSRPGLDPSLYADWLHTLRRIERRLDDATGGH